MLETIYTIPINEAFEECAASEEAVCPFCRLHDKYEKSELEIILGASMMEPDIRIKTNEKGFCHEHYDKMFNMKNRLGLALMLESHLAELKKSFTSPSLSGIIGKKGTKECARIEKLERSCYVCERLDYTMRRMYDNAALLWDSDRDFDKKVSAQHYFCLKHYRAFIEAGQKNISKKKFPDFFETLKNVEMKYLDGLSEDVSWFCKKFDYRYEDEPWNNAKDAPERAIRFLRGK